MQDLNRFFIMEKEYNTPEDFSSFYFEKLKNELNVNDISLSKSGFIGFFIETLSHTNFDIKNYYQYLFNESFPITARENHNLLLHSEIYGYTPKLTTPAIANALLEFNLYMVNLDLPIGYTREIKLDDLIVTVENDFIFKLDSKYKIISKRISDTKYDLHCELYYKDKSDVIPLLQTSPKFELTGLLQYEVEEHRFYLPNYKFGAFHIVEFKYQNQLYDIELNIRERNTNEFVYYRSTTNKFDVQENERVVFYKMDSNSNIQIEFGSGFIGKHIPDAEVILKIKTSKGAEGNISRTNMMSFNGELYLVEYNQDNKLIKNERIAARSNTSEFRQYITDINFLGAHGGISQESKESLRGNLINYIRTRDNLVSKDDFNSILNKKFDDVDIIFKKFGISENVIYIYQSLYDSLNQPIYTLTTNFEISKFEEKQVDDIIIYPEITIDDVEFICPFYFEYNGILNCYDGYILEDDKIYYPDHYPVESDSIKSRVFNISSTFLNILVNPFNNTTRIFLKNRYFSDNLDVKISIPILGVISENMIFEDDEYYYDYQGYIKSLTMIKINIIIDGENHKFIFNNVQNVKSTQNQFRIKKHKGNVMNVPLIEKSEYFKFTDYVHTTLNKSLEVLENQMVSDDIQFRFLNSFKADTYINKKLLKQKIDFDLHLPLKVKIELILDKDLLLTESLNVEHLIDEIKMSSSKFLLENCNGLDVKFYRTRLIDLTHNFTVVKYVDVFITDKNGVTLGTGIETINRKIFLKRLTKEEFLSYNPIYWWVDINNIEVITKVK